MRRHSKEPNFQVSIHIIRQNQNSISVRYKQTPILINPNTTKSPPSIKTFVIDYTNLPMPGSVSIMIFSRFLAQQLLGITNPSISPLRGIDITALNTNSTKKKTKGPRKWKEITNWTRISLCVYQSQAHPQNEKMINTKGWEFIHFIVISDELLCSKIKF